MNRIAILILAFAVVACSKGPAPGAMKASGPVVNPIAWSVPAWFVDGANVTGCAADGNTCASATCGTATIGPCRTAASIQQVRWGGSAVLAQVTTVTGLSAYQAGDYWSVNPAIFGSGSLVFAGVPPPFATIQVVTTDAGGNAIEFQGVPIAAVDGGQPAAGVVYVATGDAGGFIPRRLTADDILPGVTISSFTVSGGTVELGATVTNPSVTASYSAVPASASVTNTDAIGSPLTLTTPFTAGTVVGSFQHTAQATVTFTLTAIGTSTQTAGAGITFLPRSFAGVGGAGATGATASGSSASLVGASGTLASAGLSSSIVGQVLGPFSPATQKIYVLTFHTSTPHVFRDQNGFTFSMLLPTTFSFTNQNGAVVSMDLYESTNLLTESFTITVVL